MVDYQTISIVFTGLSVSLAAFYYISALKNTEKNQRQQLDTRQAQLFMQVYVQSLSREFIKQWYAVKDFQYKGLEDFNMNYGIDNNPDFYYSFVSIANYIDGIGVLVRQGIMDLKLVNDMMGSYAAWWWRIVESYIRDVRVNSNAPDFMVAAEYLINEMISAKKQDGTYHEWKSDQGIH